MFESDHSTYKATPDTDTTPYKPVGIRPTVGSYSIKIFIVIIVECIIDHDQCFVFHL